MANHPIALIVGANRGIGLGVVTEFLARGWDIVATARRPAEAHALASLAQTHPGRVEVKLLDMNEPAQVDGFAGGLGPRLLDVALVNAGVAGPEHRSASQATAQEIGALMVTNAIAPIRLARHLVARIRPGTGVLAFTSSVMGSVALNAGGHELYRASKAALNSLSRGLYGELGGQLTLLTLHPGWVRTDMGGSGAAVSVADSARGMVDVILREQGRHHHVFLDYTGKEIAW
ncbi:MAG: SDR family oxidoreductase [Acetobacteraceae bacterium]|nr:SDR family oxidoreductase [Acetobacteraceae bacterium]